MHQRPHLVDRKHYCICLSVSYAWRGVSEWRCFGARDSNLPKLERCEIATIPNLPRILKILVEKIQTSSGGCRCRKNMSVHGYCGVYWPGGPFRVLSDDCNARNTRHIIILPRSAGIAHRCPKYGAILAADTHPSVCLVLIKKVKSRHNKYLQVSISFRNNAA